MNKLLKTLLWILPVTLITATGWAQEAVNPKPVYLLDAGSTATEGWTTINKNGSYPAFLQADTTYGELYATTTSGGNFFNTYGAPSVGFSEGTYEGLDGTTYSSVFEEMAATLGLESIPESVYSDNLQNGGVAGHKLTVHGLDPEKCYVMYYIGGATKDSQTVAGFTLEASGYLGNPVLDYVCTSGSANHATSTVTAYANVLPVTTALRAANNGYLLVRVSYVKPTAEGCLEFKLSGERANICALAIAEIDPLEEVSAEVAESVNFSDVEWSPSNAEPNANVTLNVSGEATLTMDKTFMVNALTVQGAGPLTIAKTESNKLTAATTAINTDTTVEAGAASLGAVKLEDEKTITVADTTTVTSLTTTRGVLATSADMTITRDTGFFSGLKVLKVVGGTLTSDVTDSNGNNLTYGRDVIVTGASSNLVINKGDGTGWNSGNNSITLTEGGTLTYNYRDTLKSPFKMSGGTVKFAANCANGSGRALDVYNSNASVNDFTVTALDGATVENPTVSYITALAEESDTSGNRKILLRDGDMIVDVADTAKLHVVAELISVIGNAGGTRGKLVKNGTGVLELAGLENIHETGTNINGGVLILSNRATLGSGTTTIAENAQLVIKQGANKLSNAITNNGTIAADGEGTEVDLTGATLSGSGTYAVTNGATLILPLAQTAGKTIEVAKGATLQVELTAVEQLSAQVVTITGTGTVQFVDAGGKVLAEAEGSSAEDSTYTPAIPEYTYTLNGEGTGTWNAPPTAGAKITIAFGETEDQTVDLTTVLGEIASVAELIVTGTNGGTITKSENGSLTIGKFSPQTDVTIEGNILSSCVTAQSTITVPETKTLSIAVADGGSEWDCALKQSFAGAGVVKKIGAGSLSLLDAYTDFTCPQMIVEEGAFRMASGNTFANYANDYAITVNDGAKFMLGYNAALTGNTTITLNDGAAIECKNGNHATVSTPAIVVNGNATIRGSHYGATTEFNGRVSGNGTLTFERISTDNNPLKFSGVIADGDEGTLKVVVNHPGGIVFSGANTYTGGTDIATGAKLTITNAGALGTGAITGAGTLVCDGFMPANMTGLTDAENWTGTLALVSTPTQADIAFNSLGNASSTVRLQDYTGSLSNKTDATCYTPNLEIKGTNTINAATEYAIPIFQGDVSGDGTIVFSADKNTNYLFSGDFSAFTGTMELSHTSPKIAIGAASNTNWNAWNPIVNNGQGNITIATAATLNGTFRAVSGVETTSSAILSGNGTIDSALTLTANATIDASATLLTVTGAVTLPDALTVKIAAAPAVGTAVPLLNAANVTIPEGMTVTVMVGDEADATNTYQLVATATALLLENAPAEDVTIEGSSLDAALNWGTDQTGAGNYNGIQVDLDAETPFAPGWTAGALYPVTQFGIMERSDTNNGSIAAGVKVQVYDVAASTVIATSEAWTEKVATSLVANDGTSSYQLCKFPFAEPVWLDASKTYQFRFVTTDGGAASCGLRVLNTEDSNQRNANLLDANYNLTGTNWLPLYTLTAERIVDNSPIVSGGDEVLEVATVPETIHLNTATFGYGTHTVLQYTGEGTPDWTQMTVEGLPAGVTEDDFVIDEENKTWGFVIKTLNVLTVGDSITAGLVYYNNSNANWHVPGGYRLPLYKYLTRAGYSVKYLGSSDVFGTSSVGGGNANEANPSPSLGDNDHHEGHSGITLVTMLERFNNTNVQNEIASQGTPDVITLHLGTNDIMGVDDNTTDDAISADAEKVLTRMQNLLNRLQELYPNTKILVAKIIARSGNKNKVVTEFNKKLNTFFESNQEENLILVDLDINSVSYGLLRYDGLHPSTEGYTQMARGWFNAIEAEFDPLGDSMEAPTPATSTPMEDVTESDRTVDTVGMAGVLKVAEWTTFTDFETGYLSQFGYMPDSERPWQLDVSDTNELEVTTDGALPLNGVPITVNPVDGRLGTTKSTYTIVMKVSDLAENDVIFTDSSVRNDDWPENVNTNHKGTTNADLGKLTVVDADTLAWSYNGSAAEDINLAGVNLTDTTPDVIAITITDNQCKVAVNGGTAVTETSGSAIDESYRGSWSIGAMSEADTGSSMKLYRLSFYEGAATLPPPPSVVVNVGEYASWNAAFEAGVVSATMSATTLHFTADDQIFMFDNTDSVRLGVMTVTAEAGVTGGTIALGDMAEVTSSSLALQTNVTAPAAFYNGCAGTVTAASAETVVAVNDAAEVSLTATIQGGILKQAGTGTVTFTPGAWGSTQTPAKFEVANGTLAFGKSTTGWNNPPALVVSGGTLNLNNVYTFADNASGYLTTASPVLTMGGATATTIQGGAITPYTTGATEQMIVRYLGNDGTNAPATFAANIHSVYTNNARTRSIEVGKGAQTDGYDLEVTGTIGLSGGEYNAATLKKLGAGILKLSNTNNFPTLEVTEGTLWSNHADALGATTTVKLGATLVGSGTVATAFTLEAGATLDVTKGVVTANGSVTLPNALNVIVDSLPTDETPVVILNTTAFAAAEGVAETVVTVNEAVSGYILYKTASAVELRIAPFEAVANPVIAANEVASWTAFMAQLTANKQTVAENAVLTIDFGNGETPGSFTFDNDEALALGEVIVIGSAGGTILKDGDATVTVATTTVDANVTINAGVANLGAITINAEKMLTVYDNLTADGIGTIANGKNSGTVRIIGGTAETPLHVTMPATTDGTIGKLVVAQDAVVQIDTSVGLKYDIMGETVEEGHQKAEVRLAPTTGVGMTAPTQFRNIKLVFPARQMWARINSDTNTVYDETVDIVIPSGGEVLMEANPTWNSALPTGVTVIGTLSGAGTLNTGAGTEGDYKLQITQHTATEFSGVIKGMIKPIIAGTAPLTLSNSNTYNRGTEILAGATLIITNANAIGTTGNITGAGTLVCNGELPTTAEQRITNANWRGKVVLQAIPNFTNLDLDEFGNDDSVIELNGIGNGTNQTYMRHTQTIDSDVILTGDNWFTDGSYSTTVTFNGVISGDGAFKFKKFNGSSNPAETWIFNGAYNASIANEDATARKIIFGSGPAEGGQIVIAKSVTVANGKTWSAVNGVKVTSTGVIGGTGKIGSALILDDGATIDTTAGVLEVMGTVTLPTTQLAVTLPVDGLPTEDKPVEILKTDGFASAQGVVQGVMVVINGETSSENYFLYKTAEALELRYAPWTTVTEVTASGDVNSWSELLAAMAANRQRFDTSDGKTPSLIIDFGDADGEAVPGIFTFDLANESVLTLAAVQIQGTNGGTIAKEGEGVSISVGATSIAENVAVNVTAGAMELGTTTIAAGAEVTLNDTAALGTTDAASVANKVTGAGTLVLNGALPAGLANGSAGKLVTEEWTGTVKVVNVDNRNLDLGDLVRPGSSLALNNVKAYIYDCAMASLTLEGDFQQNNGTSERPKTQCVTINTLTGSGALIGPDNAPYCTAYNVKAVENFTGAIDLSHTNAKNTIFFFGVAPERFTASITEGNVGASDGAFTAEDFGTLYTNIALTVPAGKTWAAKGFVVEDGGSLAIAGWCDPGSRLVQNGSGAATVENGGVLDLRGLDNLSGISVTVKAGGRVLVKSGATVPDSIVFETDAILGIVPVSVDDIGSATLTVTAEGTAKTTATKKGYKTDGVTPLDNWADKEDADPNDNTLSFGYDPIFDGELCWWAYEFDNEVNTTEESNLGPISTGRDKTRMTFDNRGNSNRHCEGNEYVVTSTDDEANPVTKAIRLASGAYRSATWPEAGFTAAAYGRLTPNSNRVLFAFGQTNSRNPTIALATGASANAVQLVLIAGREDATTPWVPDVDTPYASPITVLAETTVPNATTEDHLFAFSYELKDTDDDGTKDTTEIVFYVDGDKYQPYKVNKVLTIGGGFQMGTTFGGVPDQYLTRMNEGDAAATIEFLRVYDEVLPEATFTAMANAYPYISKVGRATRTIVAGADSTWHEAGEWSQVRVVDGVPQESVAQDKPDFGTIAEPEIGTQVFLNVDGENTLYLNEFYSTPLQEGETSKLYYERLEINDVAGGDEDSLTMWAGRLNPAVAEEYKNSQSAVLTVLGYTKINTNVTFAHNVAYLSGPVAVAEGKYLHFDFSGFDVMKVPSMPVTYRLTGFLDEETRSRVTSTAPAEPVNARSIDLGYKTDVNQYTFKVDRYPVTAYFTADEMAGGNSTDVNFNNLNYVWQGNDLGKQMNWEAEAVDPQGNHIIENTLAKFVSLDAETQQEKIVTVTLATNDAEPVTLTLAEAALSKETEPMLGEQQLIVGNNVIVDYTGDAATLARTLNEASAETTGVIRTAGFTVDAWRANLSVTGGALAGVGKISGKVTFEAGATLDASAATAEACLSAKDGDFTNLKAITVDYEVVKAAGATGFKVLALAEGHTAESLTGCTVTAVKDDATTVIWTENGDEDPTLVVVREDGLYVVARPDVVVTVEAADTVIDNNSLTLPLARRAAELGAQKLTLTAVTNVKGDTLTVSIADAATLFTGVASAEDVTGDAGGATATLAYDFGITAINVVDGGEALVMQVVLSNTADLEQNTAAFAEGVSVGISCDGDAVEATEVADIDGTEGSNSGNIRYLKIAMPGEVKTHKFKARATK